MTCRIFRAVRCSDVACVGGAPPHCDDGNLYTTNDACQAGACVSSITYGLAEWQRMGECLAGPETEAAIGCECSDLDDDGYVDLQDVAEFTLRFDGN